VFRQTLNFLAVGVYILTEMYWNELFSFFLNGEIQFLIVIK